MEHILGYLKKLRKTLKSAGQGLAKWDCQAADQPLGSEARTIDKTRIKEYLQMSQPGEI